MKRIVTTFTATGAILVLSACGTDDDIDLQNSSSETVNEDIAFSCDNLPEKNESDDIDLESVIGNLKSVPTCYAETFERNRPPVEKGNKKR